MNNFSNQYETNNLNVANSAKLQFVKNEFLKVDENGMIMGASGSGGGLGGDGSLESGDIKVDNIHSLSTDEVTVQADLRSKGKTNLEGGLNVNNSTTFPMIHVAGHQLAGDSNTKTNFPRTDGIADDGGSLMITYQHASGGDPDGPGVVQLVYGNSNYTNTKGKYLVLAEKRCNNFNTSQPVDKIPINFYDITGNGIVLEPTNSAAGGSRKLLLQYDNNAGGLVTSIYDESDGSVSNTTQIAQVSSAGSYSDTYSSDIYGQYYLRLSVDDGNGQPQEKIYMTTQGVYLLGGSPMLIGGINRKSPCLTLQVNNQISHQDGQDIFDDNRNLSIVNGKKGVSAVSFRQNIAGDSGGDTHLCDLIHDGTTDLFKITMAQNGAPFKTILTLDGKTLNTITQGLVAQGTSILQNTNITNLIVSKDANLNGNLTIAGNGLVKLNNVPLTVDGDTTLGRNVAISNVNTSFTVGSKSTFNNTVTVNAPLNTTGFISSGNVYMRLPGLLQNAITRFQPIAFSGNQAIIYPQSQLNLNPYSLDGNGRFSVGQPGIFQIEANLYVPAPNQGSSSRIYGLLLYNQTTNQVVVYNNYSGQVREAFTFSATVYLDRATTYFMTIAADTTGGASPTYTGLSTDGSLNWFSIYRLA